MGQASGELALVLLLEGTQPMALHSLTHMEHRQALDIHRSLRSVQTGCHYLGMRLLRDLRLQNGTELAQREDDAEGLN